jgi:hypothetical protein
MNNPSNVSGKNTPKPATTNQKKMISISVVSLRKGIKYIDNTYIKIADGI